jgi:hypothetical protein
MTEMSSKFNLGLKVSFFCNGGLVARFFLDFLRLCGLWDEPLALDVPSILDETEFIKVFGLRRIF